MLVLHMLLARLDLFDFAMTVLGVGAGPHKHRLGSHGGVTHHSCSRQRAVLCTKRRVHEVTPATAQHLAFAAV